MADKTVIKRIELTNFMSHTHTVIEPAAGLTVLVGPNNCGKSAFVTALQILCHNAASNFVLRHGESSCQVVVETSDGHVVQWNRKKNGAASYVIDGEPFDRLRGKVPEVLHEILKMPRVECDKDQFDVHFGEQSEPVFLLRDRGKASAQFFASSSDASHLVAMQSRHKTNVSVARGDQKRLVEQQHQLDQRWERLSPVPELDRATADCEKMYQDLCRESEHLEQLHIMIRALREADQKVLRLENQCRCLEALPIPPAIDDTQPLEELTINLNRCGQRLARTDQQVATLAPLEHPPQLSNEFPLRRLLGALQRAHQQLDRSDRAATTLSKLQFPPALFEADALQRQVDQLRSIQSRCMRLEQSAKSLAKLAAPPAQPLTERLESLVAQLHRQHDILRRREQFCSVLDAVPAPPQLSSPQGLENLLAKYSASRKSLAEYDLQLEATQAELAEVTAEFENWVAANPTCPTCGASTDVKHVLEHAEAKHG